MAQDTLLFLRQLLTSPRQISAIAPSSRWLARAMAQGLGPKTGRVVEFGPGTGQLTRGILAAGVAPADLTLFEMDGEFGSHLRTTFPGVTVNVAPAQASAKLEPGVGAVVSGLPLLSMPLELQRSILGAAFTILSPGAPYIQFTYGPRPPVRPELIEELGLSVDKGQLVWANLPPARVFRFHRK